MGDVPIYPLCNRPMVRSSEIWWACDRLHGFLVAALDASERVAAHERGEFLRKMKKAGL